MRVLLAHDDRIELYGLARALADARIDVVGEAHTADQVPPLVARTRPNVLLLSTSLAEPDDWELLHDLHERAGTPVVFVLNGGTLDPQRVRAALAHGADGAIAARVDPLDIPALLRQAAGGNFCFAPPRVEESTPEPVHSELTERELSVLRGVAEGLSNVAIGRQLWLSSHTVKSHLHRIYIKLGVSNRTEAARYALEHGLATAPTAAA